MCFRPALCDRDIQFRRRGESGARGHRGSAVGRRLEKIGNIVVEFERACVMRLGFYLVTLFLFEDAGPFGFELGFAAGFEVGVVHGRIREKLSTKKQ